MIDLGPEKPCDLRIIFIFTHFSETKFLFHQDQQDLILQQDRDRKKTTSAAELL